MASKASRRKVQLLSPPLQMRQHTHCSLQPSDGPQFPRILLPQSDRHISAPAHPSAHHPLPGATIVSVKEKAPPTTASLSWIPESELRAPEQAFGALASVRMKPMRAGRISVYLRSVLQRRRLRRRHRTQCAERG